VGPAAGAIDGSVELLVVEFEPVETPVVEVGEGAAAELVEGQAGQAKD